MESFGQLRHRGSLECDHIARIDHFAREDPGLFIELHHPFIAFICHVPFFPSRLDLRLKQEPPHSCHSAPICLLLRMRAMKHGANPLQRYANSRSLPLSDLRAMMPQHSLNIRPRDIWPLLEDGFQGSIVPVRSLDGISLWYY